LPLPIPFRAVSAQDVALQLESTIYHFPLESDEVLK